MKQEITDNIAYRFPVSMKGIVIIDEKIILLKNERDEWELPGGKLELGESPIECAQREIEEELSVTVSSPTIIDTWVYHIKKDVNVLIVTYGFPKLRNTDFVYSHEHKDAAAFKILEIDDLNMPNGYKLSIKKWWHEVREA